LVPQMKGEGFAQGERELQNLGWGGTLMQEKDRRGAVPKSNESKVGKDGKIGGVQYKKSKALWGGTG